MQIPSPQPAYYQTSQFAASLGGEVVQFISKPGLPNWDRVSPAARLLAQAVTMSPGSSVLLLGSGHGALGVALAHQVPDGRVWLMDTSFIALEMSERTLQANDVRNAQVCSDITVLPAHAGAFDVVAMELPGSRKLARRWLAEAYAALRPGGQLYLAGPNNQGIQSVIDDAEALFGNAAILQYKEKNRVARATRLSPGPGELEWMAEAGIRPGTWYEFDVTVRGITFHLHSLPGVFAYDRLDDGTELLLSRLEVPEHGRVLDVGCGDGVIGLLAARLGASHVDMVDVNMLAVAAARQNIDRNAIANARAFPSDALGAVREQRYDLVVTNPPFHAGKAVEYDIAYAFIEDARSVLEPGGQLMLVANRFIRYDQFMRNHFKHVERVAENGRYQVLVAR